MPSSSPKIVEPEYEPSLCLSDSLAAYVLSFVPLNDLKDKVRLVSTAWCRDVGIVLSKSLQTLIKTSQDLEYFLRWDSDGYLVNPYKLSHIIIDFLPTVEQLDILENSCYGIHQLTIAAPTSWNQEGDKFEDAKKFLSKPLNVKLNFTYKRYFGSDSQGNLSNRLYGWTLEDLKQLWDSLATSVPSLNLAQQRLIQSLQGYVCQLEDLNFLSSFPFITNIVLGRAQLSLIPSLWNLLHPEADKSEASGLKVINAENFGAFIRSNTHITSLKLYAHTSGFEESQERELSNTHKEKLKKLLESIKRQQTLTRLNLSGSLMDDDIAESLSQALKLPLGLKSLTLEGIFTDKGISFLSEALLQNASLKTLRLISRNLSDASYRDLATILIHNNTLKHLIISPGMMPKSKEACEIYPVFNALRNNTTLRKLNVSNFMLSLQSQEGLMACLAVNHNLEELKLENCNIQEQIANQLATILTSNRSIKALSLEENYNITPAVAKRFADMRETNVTLKFLNLSLTSIGFTGIEYLAKALSKNRTLRSLDIGHIKTDPSPFADESKAVQAIADGLKINSGLEHLNYEHNIYKPNHSITIINSLIGNQSLKSLELRGGYVDESFPAALKEALSKNQTLEHLVIEPADDADPITPYREALQASTALRSLIISSEEIYEEDLLVAQEIMKHKPHLIIEKEY